MLADRDSIARKLKERRQEVLTLRRNLADLTEANRKLKAQVKKLKAAAKPTKEK